uniref:50S ribosomal protein L20-like protein n=1 Tax=Sheathia arcuata TaxID=340433 RepID=A0A1Z1XA97_9FLOR|nr:50S ribosomal protein L20-like protein [Sheathia arcuata]ARX95763.1 50S ribosomal protein L20-like protein [Sheathia arcuata]
MLIMCFKKAVKNEIIKTRNRKLKKRNYRKSQIVQLNNLVTLFYVKYGVLTNFINTQNCSITLNLFSQLLLEEVGVSMLAYYWLKLYYSKIY